MNAVGYVTPAGDLEIVLQDPEGRLLKQPTNICFGGPERRTAYLGSLGGKRHSLFPGPLAGDETGPSRVGRLCPNRSAAPGRARDADCLAYHDREWGLPVHDDRQLFEMLVLQGAQAGLSWMTILKKRENYRRAFQGFDPAIVAGFSPARIRRLLEDPGLVRNRGKIESAVVNAPRRPASPGRVRHVRPLRLVLCRRTSRPEPLADPGGGAGRYGRIRTPGP